ncbi:MAG: SUMF1/EgtB/PvdO family nonheme iron enzyme [Deltaproteobacteria bacterium]|nr:SUMF1/EgtB/PvdO family nonheme iron enzyme [Deltaproteobacteria bacterium]
MPNAPRSNAASPATDPFDLVGVTIADKFRVDTLVGSGGFGVVYRGEHLGFEEPIAIKCLKLPGGVDEADRPAFLARLQEEGRVLHRLSKQTSGIVQALDVGVVTTPGGQWIPYLVLEWLEGKTLAALIAERRASGRPRMSLEEALDLLQPAADALAVAHRQKVAHRDVKPENVFVTTVDGRRTVKVLDFGIAKVLTHHASFASMATQKGATAFTPSYGAPEQFNKKRGATGPWTDVFALALLVVELVSGERALDGDDATQLYIASADPASRPTPRHHGVRVSDAAEDVLATALAVDPADRYPDVEAFWSALRQAAGREPAVDAAASDVSDTGDFVNRSGFDFGEPSGRAGVGATEVMAEAIEPDAPLARATARSADEAQARPHPSIDTSRTPSLANPARSDGAHRDGDRTTSATRGPSATEGAGGTENATTGAPRATKASLPVLPFTVGLALAGAGALAWQLNTIGPSTPPRHVPTATATARPAPRLPSIKSGSPSAAASLLASAPSPSASASATPAGAGGAGGGDASDGGAGGRPLPAPAPPPPGMVRIMPSEGARAFFLDRTEVSTRAYLACVMAGRCKKATRVVLTEESARAFGVPDSGDALAPEQLAAAWEKRCNQTRGAEDHPINCVSWASAEDYCSWKKRRLPTSAEWTQAAMGGEARRYTWGDEAPDCTAACFGLNGSCLSGTNPVTSCSVGSHRKDVTSDGLLDLTGNVAEWVSDEAGEDGGGGPRFRLLRGGSFIDEAAVLELGKVRSAPPVTAYVAIGFRCAADAP